MRASARLRCGAAIGFQAKTIELASLYRSRLGDYNDIDDNDSRKVVEIEGLSRSYKSNVNAQMRKSKKAPITLSDQLATAPG